MKNTEMKNTASMISWDNILLFLFFLAFFIYIFFKLLLLFLFCLFFYME